MVLQVARIRGATRTLGQSQGFIGLPIRDGMAKDPETGAMYPCMQSAWTIEPNDIERILSGEPLIVELWGRQHPPIKLTVGDDFKLPADHPDSVNGVISYTRGPKPGSI